MTEDMFYTWSKTAEAGFLSPSQAQAKWTSMLLGSSVYREEGEGGAGLRLAVKLFDDIIDYDDVELETQCARPQAEA